MDVILGIDLGTTQHRVALWRDGRAEVFPNRFSGHRLPAEIQANGAGGWQIGSWKRRLGSDQGAEREIAEVLRQLLEDAAEAGGDSIRGALFAVPASYTERQRALLREAARQAGVPAARLLDEAIAFIHGSEPAQEPTLVLSWGAASLQAAVLRPEASGWRLLASESELGGAGNEIDSDFMPFLSGRIFGGDVALDAGGARKLHGATERMKTGLSRRAKEEQEIDPREFLPQWEGPAPVPVAVSRQEFGDLLAPRMEQLRKRIIEAVSNSGIEADKVLQVLLSGGSTRIPFLDAMLPGILPNARLLRAPDTAIARGAALFGGSLSQDEWRQAAERAAEAARENEQAARMDAPSHRSPSPRQPRAGKWMEHLAPSVQEAERLWDLGHRTESVEAFRRFLEHDARIYFAHLLYRTGKEHFRNDRFSEAVQALQEAYRYTPDDKEVEHYYHVSLNRHATRALEQGDIAKARASIEIGLKLDPTCEGCRQLAKQIHAAMQRGRMPGMAFKRKRK